MLLSEIKALRNIKKGLSAEIVEDVAEEYEEEHQRREEQIQSIDQLVDDVKSVTTPSNPLYNSAEPAYNSISETDRVAVASDSRTIGELYALAEKENITPEDRNRLFDITNAIVRSRPYELNPAIQDRVDTAYQTVKNIISSRPELVQDYQPSAPTSAVNQFIESLKKSPVTDYKP